MSASLIERVARIVATHSARHQGKDDGAAKSFGEAAWPDYIDDARAVLIALRDPTDLDLGKAIRSHDGRSWDEHLTFWNAMIDAAVAAENTDR